MQYIGAIISLFAALVALRGQVWDEKQSGIRKLTRVGYLIALLAILGFLTSLATLRRAEKDAEQSSLQLNRAVSNTDSARSAAKDMEEQLKDYRTMLLVALKRSERQPQTIMAEYVHLDENEVWHAPNLIYPGSIVKLYFSCDVKVSYRGHTELVRKVREDHSSELPIVGSPGIGLQWELRSLKGDSCEGKVYIESTPRIREAARSWQEEAD